MNGNKKIMPESFYSLDTEMSFDKIKRAKDSGDFLVVKVISWDSKKECLQVNLGNDITGIIPLSEFTIYPTKRSGQLAPSVYTFISKTVCACVIDSSSDNIVLSRRRNMLKAFNYLSSTQGETISCQITSIVSYGFFTDVGHGLAGLMHVSDITVDRIYSPEILGFKTGQLIDAKIISINDVDYHLSLSHKDIFDDISNIYNEGDIIPGIILTPIDESESGYFIHIHPALGGIMNPPSEEKIPYGTKVIVRIKAFRKDNPQKVKLAFVAFDQS